MSGATTEELKPRYSSGLQDSFPDIYMYFSSAANRIAALLIERNETICVAESTTGGLISANLLSVPGASAYFEGGSVVYTMASRKAFLTLKRDRLRGLEPLTEAMAIALTGAGGGTSRVRAHRFQC